MMVDGQPPAKIMRVKLKQDKSARWQQESVNYTVYRMLLKYEKKNNVDTILICRIKRPSIDVKTVSKNVFLLYTFAIISESLWMVLITHMCRWMLSLLCYLSFADVDFFVFLFISSFLFFSHSITRWCISKRTT